MAKKRKKSKTKAKKMKRAAPASKKKKKKVAKKKAAARKPAAKKTAKKAAKKKAKKRSAPRKSMPKMGTPARAAKPRLQHLTTNRSPRSRRAVFCLGGWKQARYRARLRDRRAPAGPVGSRRARLHRDARPNSMPPFGTAGCGPLFHPRH
jgi:hypothetical protein